VLRHGNRTLVEGTSLIGSSAHPFYENDHVIINNVIQAAPGESSPARHHRDDQRRHRHARGRRCGVQHGVGNQTNLIDVGSAPDPLGPTMHVRRQQSCRRRLRPLVNVAKGTNLHWQGNIVFAGTGENMPAAASGW